MSAEPRPVEDGKGGLPPVLDVDPFTEEVLADPYPFHEHLRELAPVVELARYGIYAVGRHDEVQTVMSDHERFMAAAGTGLYDLRKPGAWRSRSPLLECDPPDHTRMRMALTRIISPVVVRKWRADFETEAQRVVDRIIDMREIDAVRDVAEAFVLTVFPASLGVDIPHENAVAIGDMNFNAIGPNNDIFQRSLRKVEPILEWYQQSFQRESMIEGGFGQRIYEAEDAGELPVDSAPGLVRSFIRGGMDTTIAGIGFALNQLARNPAQWAKLHDDPALVKSAFEEAIRHESPSQTQFRTVVRNTVLGGMQLVADRKVAIFMGAANRDKRKWERPEEFDISRRTTGVHLAFGWGAHQCIGQMIARMEAEVILSALARRVRRIELSGTPTYRLINTLRTLECLPLRVEPV
ncbi:MAG: cytochrome P450 [Rhizobiaceae bacterium]|nr:cytochrome P450 [Rhizobiaceae bacterium]MCV0404928.1 cytochrome P450 [Rhizobiaceae bacterium]